MANKISNDVSIERLKDLVNKLDAEKEKGHNGYIVERDGLIEILESLTSQLSTNIMFADKIRGLEINEDYVQVKVHTTFTLSRSELGM